MTREGTPSDSASHAPAAAQEQSPEADIFTREGEAKRLIYDSAGALMEHLRPGKPFRLILDVQRGERQPDSVSFYRALPQGALYLYTEVDQRAGEDFYEVSEAMARAVTLNGRGGGLVDEAGQVNVTQQSENFLGGIQDGEPARTNNHHDGLRFRITGDRQEQIDPQATDERVVVIQEILGHALQEVVARLEAPQPPQEPVPTVLAS